MIEKDREKTGRRPGEDREKTGRRPGEDREKGNVWRSSKNL